MRSCRLAIGSLGKQEYQTGIAALPALRKSLPQDRQIHPDTNQQAGSFLAVGCGAGDGTLDRVGGITMAGPQSINQAHGSRLLPSPTSSPVSGLLLHGPIVARKHTSPFLDVVRGGVMFV